MKLCRSCNLWLTLADFANTRVGAMGTCRECQARRKPRLHKAPAPSRPQTNHTGKGELFAQVHARVQSGDSPRFACERVGVDVAEYDVWKQNQRAAIEESEAGLSLARVMREAGMRK